MSATHGRGGGGTNRRTHRRRISASLIAVALLATVGGACSDDGGDDAPTSTTEGERASGSPTEPRFCDVYLDYLADSTPARLSAVVDAADDQQVTDYATVITSDAGITEILAATLDLDELARLRCQPEWTGGAQGTGSTPATAQAFFDAVVAGDRSGAANIAAANAIAVFEPWEPVPVSGETPALVEVGEHTFTVIVDPTTFAQCQVEVGVVVACQFQS